MENLVNETLLIPVSLSLGHCFSEEDPNYIPQKYIKLYFGASSLDQITGDIPYNVFSIQKRTIKRVIPHKNYTYPYAYHDISIIGIAF